MPVQSPDFAPRWVLGSLPEDPAEFQRVLAGRLHGLEQWVRAAHARINFTQPFILPPVKLAAPYSPPAGLSAITGVTLSFTSAIRATALVLVQVDAQATAASSTGTIAISVNGAAEVNTVLVMADLSNGERAVFLGFALVPLSAATAYVIKLRGAVNAGGGFSIITGRTKLSLIGCPASYTLP